LDIVAKSSKDVRNDIKTPLGGSSLFFMFSLVGNFLSIVVNMTCRISRFQDGGPFHLNPLVTTCRLKSSSSYERIKSIQVTVLFFGDKVQTKVFDGSN
jgi:hypothetical protein